MQTATVSPTSNPHPSVHSAPQPVARAEASEADRLGEQITELCCYLYAAEARLLTLIREFDAKECYAEQGFGSCAHWLNFKCGISMNAAREKVRVAKALAELPKIEATLARGELSYSKVRAMTRIADAGNEDYLLMIARHGTAHHVEKLVSKYRSAKRMQDAAVAESQYRDRELSHYYDHDGCLVIKARLPAEQGALIVKALEMAMEKDFVESKQAVEQAGQAGQAGQAERADAVAPDAQAAAKAAADDRPVAARRADALANIAETYMNNDESSGSTADRYQVVVHVTAETSYKDELRDVTAETSQLEDGSHVTAETSAKDKHLDVTAETSQLKDGPHVTAETSRRICCDSTVIKIKEDETGEPLSIGRRSRSIPPAMRRALRVRDGGCRFPGCTHTRFVDGHHIKHWADNGETSLDNLVLLCRHHHHLVHEGGFTCEKSKGGEIWFRDPRHRPLPTFSELPRVASDQELQRWLDNEFFEATADNDGCDAKWYAGEQIDWHMAVSALFAPP